MNNWKAHTFIFKSNIITLAIMLSFDQTSRFNDNLFRTEIFNNFESIE